MTQATDVTANEAAAMLAEGRAVLIDVREPEEFRSGHIAYAMSVPLGEVQGLLPKLGLPTDRTIIFQCLKGGRGAQACALADTAWPGEVRNLAGGIEAWVAAGLPVAGASTGGGAGLPLMRQVQIAVGLLVLASALAGIAGFAPGVWLAGLFGFMLAFAGVSGWCGMALVLQRMPWNRMG